MSLQVWLPLTKDLRQQGLSNVTVTNNGATYSSTGGKLGGCYTFDGNDYVRISMPSEMTTLKGTSVAAWVKSTSSTLALGGISNDVNYTVPMCTLYTSGWQFGNDAQNGYRYVSGGTVANTSVWHHVCCTVSDTTITTYLDGVQVTSGAISGVTTFTSANFIEIGCDHPGGDEYLTGSVNDFRIYDHCLSQMEVKELAKGLVLHYNLNDIYLEATTNLVTTEDGLSSTCYNGATSKYGYGTNTDMYKTVGVFNGRKSTKVYMGTAGLSAYPYVYFDFFNASGTSIKTLSFDYYPTLQNTIVPYSYNGTYNFSYTANDTSGSATNVSQIIIPVEVGKWNHITITAQKTDTTNTTRGIGYIRIGSASHTSTTSNYWLFSNIQVEEKDHATGYAGIGGTRTPTTVYDCSGFCNNGEIINSLTINSNTPKYSVSTHISATNQKIHISNFPTSGFGNSYSFAWWGKRSSNSPMFWGFSDGIRLNGMYAGTLWNTGDSSNNPIYTPGTTTTITAPSVNTWHHYVMTGDGTTCKLYLDGELYGQAKTYKAISGTSIYINGWDSSTSYCSDNTDMSDFRIYATALSADDVLSLYNNSAYIDSSGNVYGAIIRET